MPNDGLFISRLRKYPQPERFFAVFGRFLLSIVFFSGLLLSALAVKAPTPKPPLGWNSYDCWSYGVTEDLFKQNVDYMADSLKQYGWEYCVIDFIWWIPLVGPGGNINQDANFNPRGYLDQYGRWLPDTNRFPSSKGGKGLKPLADYVHAKGLKFGLHAMRGIPRQAVAANYPIENSNYKCADAADKVTPYQCMWLNAMWAPSWTTSAAQDYYNSIVRLYNSWDVDYLKIDDISAPYYAADIEGYAKAIAAVSREIVFSTSPGETPLTQSVHVSQYVNMWRLLADLWDTWPQLAQAFEICENWNKKNVAGPGQWPDPDMLPFGHLALYGPVGVPRYSLETYTKGEHYMMMSLWCIDNCPLMYGGHLPDNDTDPFYNSLLTNKEALHINQNGVRVRVLQSYSTSKPIWVSQDPNDSTCKFLCFVNMTEGSAQFSVALKDIGITGSTPARDVWQKKDLGSVATTFTQTITRHNAGLYVLGKIPDISVLPRPQTKLHGAAVSSERVVLATGGSCIIPAMFAGKTVKAEVYDLSGKRWFSIKTAGRSFKLPRGLVSSQSIYLVKLMEIR